jgi:hypothetical protein
LRKCEISGNPELANGCNAPGVSFASYAMKFGKIFGEAKQQLELK